MAMTEDDADDVFLPSFKPWQNLIEFLNHSSYIYNYTERLSVSVPTNFIETIGTITVEDF